MGIRPCGVKMIRRCEQAVGAYVLRVNGNGGHVFGFVTDEHRHGTWNQRTGEVSFTPDPLVIHWLSCRCLFGPDAIDRSLWGLIDSDGTWRAVDWGKGRPLPTSVVMR